jgi:CBS domain-containing protein
MHPEVWQIGPEECLASAAALMRDNRAGALAVVHGKYLVGILTERELVTAMTDGVGMRDTPVWSYMSARPVVTSPDADADAAQRLMIYHNVELVLVMRSGELRGVLHARDVAAAEARIRPRLSVLVS